MSSELRQDRTGPRWPVPGIPTLDHRRATIAAGRESAVLRRACRRLRECGSAFPESNVSEEEVV
jgi:hypothetical protein